MAVFDKRSFIGDDEEEGKPTPLVWSSNTIVREEKEGVKTIPLEVYPNASQLFVAVGGDGSEPAAAEASGVTHVDLIDPDGKPVKGVTTEGNKYGSVIFVVEAPREGMWRAVVRHTKNSTFVVRACGMRDRAMEKIRAKWPDLACKGCKECLQGLIAAAVVSLAGFVAGAALPTTTFIGMVAKQFRLPERVVEYILKRMFDVSLDRLIDEVCVQMEMCPES